mmetsp:Transcript_84619/g.244592  ORF Transcript_84619/g.244592 Transcript_84619/m.244592 type:complete len:309 (+) Transcript_84619:1042-1968(+)
MSPPQWEGKPNCWKSIRRSLSWPWMSPKTLAGTATRTRGGSASSCLRQAAARSRNPEACRCSPTPSISSRTSPSVSHLLSKRSSFRTSSLANRCAASRTRLANSYASESRGAAKGPRQPPTALTKGSNCISSLTASPGTLELITPRCRVGKPASAGNTSRPDHRKMAVSARPSNTAREKAWTGCPGQAEGFLMLATRSSIDSACFCKSSRMFPWLNMPTNSSMVMESSSRHTGALQRRPLKLLERRPDEVGEASSLPSEPDIRRFGLNAFSAGSSSSATCETWVSPAHRSRIQVRASLRVRAVPRTCR